ncbi:hypothetical protein AB0F36_14130 [Streptomyces sp. NPDC029080]|uniref:DUF7620 family protein n=1 Tax=Streptomyces sp. NPDC029080 TaxID=3155017 RepID=UPI0033BFC82C
MIAWLKRLVHGPDEPEATDSETALERAREARQAAEARRPIVEAVAATLRRAREENHFAERIEAAYATRKGAAP